MTDSMLIQGKNITAGYTADILHDVSLSLHAGERLAIIGPNGCGKTTLLRVLAGILPYKGSLLQTIQSADSNRQGKAVERASLSGREASRETGFLAQLSSSWLSFHVYDTVMLGRYNRQKPGFFSSASRADREEVERAMNACGIADIADERLSCLSGGQLQRVFLARTLAQDPAVLLLDEPTNHLDLHFQFEFLDLIDHWVSTGNRGSIGVFHDLSLALRFADTMLLMNEGRVISCGAPKDIVKSDEINKVYRMNVASSIHSLLQNW